MSINITIDDAQQHQIQKIMADGFFSSEQEVIESALQLLEAYEAKHREKINAAIEQSLADVEAGRFKPAEEVFAELKNRYQIMIDAAE